MVKSSNYEVFHCAMFLSHINVCTVKANIILKLLFSDTVTLCSSINVRGQLSRPYKNLVQYYASQSLRFETQENLN